MRAFYLAQVCFVVTVIRGVTGLGGADQGMEDAITIQREQLERMSDFLGPPATRLEQTAQAPTISFANPAAKKFLVDGKKIPDGNYI
jgi:carboxypeptidase D